MTNFWLCIVSRAKRVTGRNQSEKKSNFVYRVSVLGEEILNACSPAQDANTLSSNRFPSGTLAQAGTFLGRRKGPPSMLPGCLCEGVVE